MCSHHTNNAVGHPLKLYSLHQLDEMERDIAAAHRLNDDLADDAPASPSPAAFPNMALAFALVPALGTEVMCKGQPYTLIEVKPYTRKDGAASQLLVWEAPCWTCNEPFLQTVALGGANYVNRRCSAHARAGYPVKREGLPQ